MTDAPAMAPAATSTTPRSNGDFAIETNNLCKTYSQGLVFKKKHTALQNVSLTVRRGEIFGLLGPNGAGKTTFLKIMLGIIRKTNGDASLLGFPAGSRQGRQLVGYLPEHLRVPAHLTGYQALEFFGNLSNVPTSVVRAKRGPLLETVGLAQRAKDNVRQYSKGMLQRLGLAQALLHEPELLVLDEPTDGLDPKARAEMRQIIRTLSDRGVTIFLNSHLLQEVEMICQRVAILDKGILRYCGSVDTIGDFLSETLADSGGHVGATVEFQLAGDEQAIKNCFDNAASFRKDPNTNNFIVSIPTAKQADVDKMVDSLRSIGVSIIGVAHRRVSLEDAFLALVDESSFKN